MNAIDERFVCRNTARLETLKDSTFPGTPNAIDYVEVRDHDEPTKALRQRTLFLHLIRLLSTGTVFGPDNVVITGGDRVGTVPVTWVQRADSATAPAGVALADWQALVSDIDEPDLVLVIRTDVRGDFSTYLLSLVTPGSTNPPPGFDEELSSIALRFKVECPTDFDCRDAVVCEPDPPIKPPPIDYLAKDFTGFRRILLERLSQLSPAWAERNVGDLGIALVELLAYTADELSWRQDAIATEAYLGTARSRRSLRRHARLVDYRIHEGASARVFARIDVSADVTLPGHTPLLTAVPDQTAVISTADAAARIDLIRQSATIFETAAKTTLHADCKEIALYTWGDPTACLNRGATSATLLGRPTLAPGDVLVLAETVSPITGRPQDADPEHRYAVRLTTVTPDQDAAGGLFQTPQSMTSIPVTRITWHAGDALPRSLPLVDADSNPLAVAWGNIVLADHGETIAGEAFDLGAPVLRKHGLAFVVDPPPDTTAASTVVTTIDPRGATPAVTLTETDLTGATNPWVPQPDLLESEPAHRHFVVEVDTDRSAWLRFGDGHLGMAPPPTSTYVASYRIGGGAVGNIGGETLRHIVVDGLPAITGVSNPMPAQGGAEPETPDQIRRDAPQAFLVQERAVTPEDYSAMAVRSGTVLQAATTFRWTGSWNTVFVTADRPDAQKVDGPFVTTLREALEPYRMAGYDLEIDAPVVVPLQVEVFICAGPGHLRSDVAAAAYDVLSSHRNADGTIGLFHPDRWTFGQSVYLSSIYAAVQAIEGVSSVEVTTFQRLDQPLTSGLDAGVLAMQRLEIPRLDNDPDFPERGQLTITLGGGR